MKIIHISPSYKPAWCYGGPIQSVSLLCESLQKKELEIDVITTTANGKTELDVPREIAVLNTGVKIHYFNRLTKDHTHFSPKLLLHLHRNTNEKDTLLHIHSWWNLVSMLSCLIAKIKGIPVVLSPRGMLCDYTFKTRNSFSKAILHQIIGKQLLRYCQIHCTTQQEKQEIINIGLQKDISVIPNLIDTNLATAKSTINHEDCSLKIIFISRIDPKKGLEMLFQALSKLQFSWSLSLAGKGKVGYIQSLHGLADDLNISHAITWHGQIDNTKKYALIAQHHLLVLFSHNENFGNVVLESLLTGTPVAISEGVGLSDYVKTNQLGWTVQLNPRQIAEALHHAYKSRWKRSYIQKTAPSLIRKHYNPELLSERYIELYRQLS